MLLYNNFKPAVSIIIPAFNRVNLLTRAIDSVCGQSFKFWEIILVDDGSEDGTFRLIKKYQDDFSNIRYLRHSNRKLPLSLNAGIIASAGEFITFLGSDDEYEPEHLKLRIDLFGENPELDFIHGGVKIIGGEFVPDKNDTSKKIHISECVIGGTFFGKKKVFLNENGFNNIKYSEDSEFFERIKNKYKIQKVDWQTYIYHRDTADSITNNF